MSTLVVKEAIRARLGRLRSRLEEAWRAWVARRKEKQAEEAMGCDGQVQYLNQQEYMLAICRGEQPVGLIIVNKFPGDAQYFVWMK